MSAKSKLTRLAVAVCAIIALTVAADKFTWKDWNSTPRPEEGQRIDNLYDFASFYLTNQRFHRFEFRLDKKVNDAWIVFHSYMSAPLTHKIFLNGVLNYEHPEAAGVYDSNTLVIQPAKGLKLGDNVVSLNSQWFAFSLIVNLADGSQTVITAGPGWRSFSHAVEGWDMPGYKGASEETQYRLGHEGYHLTLNPFPSRPYVGLVDVNMNQANPIYGEGAEIEWTVSIPLPFYGQESPVLRYTMENAFEKSPPVAGEGKLTGASNGRGQYLVRLDSSRPGAYTVVLSFGEGEAMRRKEELVIVGPIKQPVVAQAADLIKSLDLTLVDKIDCTDLAAPPLQNGKLKGKVVTSKGMTYFETGPTTGFLAGPGQVDYAMWKLGAKDLNQWHLVEIDVPDDKDRAQIVALVHNLKSREFGVESTIELGKPRPLTDKIYTHRMLFIPKFHDVRIMVAPSLRTGVKEPVGAAVKAVRFYRVDGELPMLRLGGSGRVNANYNERADLIGASHYPGSDAFNLFMAPQQYRRWYQAIKCHVEYTRFLGQNAVCHGLYQYVKEGYPNRPGQTDFVALMLDMYNANGISFYCNNEYFTSAFLEGHGLTHRVKDMLVSDEEVADGKDTCRLVSNTGKQATGGQFNNPCHPAVRADVLRVVGDISARYASKPAFKGMMVFAGTMGCCVDFRGPEWGYGDVTYNKFKAECRVDAPEFSGKSRFAARHDWIKRHAWNDWQTFRCRKVYELYKAMIDRTRQYSADAVLVVNICAWPWQGNVGGGTLGELKEKLLGTGTDPRMFANDPAMLVMNNDWMGQHIAENELKFVENYNRNPKIWDYITQGKPCGVFFWTGFYEMSLYFPREMSNPIWYDEALASKFGGNIEKRFIGSAGKAGRNYLSAFSNAFAYADPVFFSNRFTDVAEHRGFLEQRAEAGLVISFIPKGHYSVQRGSTGDLVLKRDGGNAYLLNNVATETTLTLTLSGDSPKIINPVSDATYPLTGVDGGFLTSPRSFATTLTMQPYQIIPLKLENVAAIQIAQEGSKPR